MFWGVCVAVSHRTGVNPILMNNYAPFELVFFQIQILCNPRLSVIRRTFKTGLQSAIKMIYLIILVAVRKGYKGSATCRILTCDNLVAGTTSLCLQTWRNDTVPCSNFPQIPTRTTQIKKHHKLTVVNQAKGDSFEHWLVMYLPKYRFGIFFYRKKLRTATLSFFFLNVCYVTP